MSDWNAATYLRFAEERTRPCRDLAAAVPGTPTTAVDLGCGPGNSTAVLLGRWPGLVVTGVDRSVDMLTTARAALPGVAFVSADLGAWNGGPVDLVFANASLQWLPDPLAALPRLLALAAPGGTFAFQVPANADAPAHTAMRTVGARAPYATHTRGVVAWQTLEAAPVYDVLAPLAARLDLWVTEYQHVLDAPEALLDWYRGTGLRPWLDALPEALRARFEAEWLAEVAPAHPRRADGRVLFPFRRLFCVATR